ncbi:DNA-binding protein [Methanocella sp. CWC-04]|uniref:DNA-binding protein n=1 Tax=Methanooceanicella nereidis TaxID=2052831 RepID=A0AAP2W8D1_9EURY|nr:DNA-binding protein [Methanocella sp. CWC-04]
MAREVAKRLFAKEFNASNKAYKENDDQYAPTYMLTPTGAKCNRVFVVGTLIEKNDIGEESENWRGRVADPTGSFVVYAGQYQPEAAQQFSDIDVPSFVAVIGKPRVYITPEGDFYTSIRAEMILPVDEATRDLWVADTIDATAERLKALKSGENGDVAMATEHYNTDVEEYKEMLITAAKSLKPMEISVTSLK